MGSKRLLYITLGLAFAASATLLYSFDSFTEKPIEPRSELAQPLALANAAETNVPPAEEPVLSMEDPNPFVQKMLSQYEVFITNAIHAGHSPGAAVAIVKDSSIIFLKGFGLKEVGTPDSVDVNTVFRLGSVSKCFASVLTGALVNDHIFNWDDPVIQYVPDFALKTKESTEKLTLRHVLSHTMGLPYHAFTNMIEERAPLDTLFKELRNLDLVAEPGKVYSYQNVGYSVIGKVIESATKKSFEQALHDKLFIPLRMKNSSASFLAMVNNPNIARPHHFTRKHWVSVPVSDTYYDVTPAGGVNASIADMALWLKALLGNNPEVLTDKTLSEIFQPQVKAISKNRNFWKWKKPKASFYALGWRVLMFKNDTIDYHGGYVNGYRSEVALDRKNKIAICVLTNSVGNLADLSIPQFLTYYGKQADSIAMWEDKNKFMLAGKPSQQSESGLNK
jgi:beta-lactamase class C